MGAASWARGLDSGVNCVAGPRSGKVYRYGRSTLRQPIAQTDNPTDPGKRQPNQSSISRDENIRPSARRQREMERIGRSCSVPGSNHGELHRCLGRERHNFHCGRLHQHPAIVGDREEIILPRRFHQDLAKQKIARELRVPTGPDASQNRLCRSPELRISFEEVNPDH
jgi:hypothetical protein